MVPKFEGEGRSSNGVAAILPLKEDGTVGDEEGIRLKPYIYSGCEIASIGKWEGLIQEEIHRIKNLPIVNMGTWRKDLRPKGLFWEEDPLHRVPGIGVAIEKLLNEQDLIYVKDLCSMNSMDIDEVVSACNRRTFTVKKLTSIRDLVLEEALPGHCPYGVVDYRQAANPYLARYGDDREKEIQCSPTLKKYRCITDMVEHIDEESRRAFVGTRYEGNYFFYHDALTQMTDGRCVEWMKAKGIYDRWIKPELGLNDEIWAEKKGKLARNTRYSGRPVGNSPELNPLDNSCFRDFRLNLSLNVAAT